MYRSDLLSHSTPAIIGLAVLFLFNKQRLQRLIHLSPRRLHLFGEARQRVREDVLESIVLNMAGRYEMDDSFGLVANLIAFMEGGAKMKMAARSERSLPNGKEYAREDLAAWQSVRDAKAYPIDNIQQDPRWTDTVSWRPPSRMETQVMTVHTMPESLPEVKMCRELTKDELRELVKQRGGLSAILTATRNGEADPQDAMDVIVSYQRTPYNRLRRFLVSAMDQILG